MSQKTEADELDKLTDEQLAAFYRETAKTYFMLCKKISERGMLINATHTDGMFSVEVYRKLGGEEET